MAELALVYSYWLSCVVAVILLLAVPCGTKHTGTTRGLLATKHTGTTQGLLATKHIGTTQGLLATKHTGTTQGLLATKHTGTTQGLLATNEDCPKDQVISTINYTDYEQDFNVGKLLI